MSEKIYRFLLRLYPPGFRQAYSDEALQLVRDRFQHERGFRARTRLWFDLLSDLVISLPREFRSSSMTLAGVEEAPHVEGAPGFVVLEDKPLTPTSWLLGGVVSVASFIGALALIGHGGSNRMLHPWSMHPERQLHGPSFAREPAPPQPGASGDETVLGADGANAAFSPQRSQPADRVTATASAGAKPQTGATAATTGEPGIIVQDVAYRQQVIAAVVANLKQHYFDPDAAERIVNALEQGEKSGADDITTSNPAFANQLTYQMRAVSQDMHLEVVYSPTVLPFPAALTSGERVQYRLQMAESNCTFELVKMLPHNVGYLKFDWFPEPAVCEKTMTAAMASLNGADAVIFDLRDNRGGWAEGTAFMAGYLFDHPVHWFDPRVATAQQPWTHSPVAGSRLADKPIYVLTSGGTISAAEQFTYILKALKRATIVGERTRGAAHAGVFHRIDDHFGVAIPEVKSENPYGKADWEGVGIEPDVKVKATDALETAEKLAARRVQQIQASR